MVQSNMVFASAVDLARAIRERRLSSKEVVQAFSERIEAANPRVNALVCWDSEKALRQAKAADQQLARGEVVGPLHGVPVTIKDAINTKDFVTTAGVKAREQFQPREDATVVRRLRQAGAIILGKTNLSELCLQAESINSVYGRTNNPFNLERSAGGSSGGEAALIASGGSPLGFGSDAGGSIRIPSHFCGVCGLKPTRGRVPSTGHFPPNLGLFNEIGPLARYVRDLDLGLRVTMGADWIDPTTFPMGLGDYREVELGSLRAAFFFGDGRHVPSPETIKVVKSVAAALADDLQCVQEVSLPFLADFYPVVERISAHFAQTIPLLHEVFAPIAVDPTDLGLLDIWLERAKEASPNNELSVTELVLWVAKRDALASRFLSFMADWDVLIGPVCAQPALPHGFSENPSLADARSYTLPFNWTGLPVVVVRAGTSPEGLPIGVQIAAKLGREDIAFAVAEYLEKTLPAQQEPYGWLKLGGGSHDDHHSHT